MNKQVFDKIMQTMLELEFSEESSIKVAEDINFEIHRNFDKFNKKQTWLLALRFAWFREIVWNYQKYLI